MGSIGGLMLIMAAFLMYKGKIFYASMFYLMADIFWVTLALQASDLQGAVFITMGFLLNLGVFIKMNKGTFVKDLHTIKKGNK